MHVVRTNQPAEMVGEPGGIRRHESSVCIVDLCVGRVRTRSMPSLWTRVMMTPELRKTGDGASHAPFQVDWWELFFDLIFIGVAIGLDDAVVVTLSDPQPISVAFTILVSFVFTLLWFDFTLYFNRFETKGDVYTTNSLFLYALSIVLMSVSIGHIHNGLGLRFCLFASMSCVSMALVYVPICLRGGPGERQFARMRIMLLAVDCALWILAGSLWGFPQIQVAVVAIIIIKVFSVEFVFTGDSFRLSRNPIHLSDRHYTLVLVFLGEILAKLIRTRPSTMSPAQLGALVLSFQICFTVKQLCTLDVSMS
ncbi:hypothetical protein PBRA_000254 [Plasmodiophora brassicae]|uniref:Low temperature requirement protein A n=1 Tax=Plasmodiophora brassicae TaxID=37360 RepID=A0A0G4IH12_PLABS|nr:hypothetical protein PBRA_000254 [Plasmodiophora brassicae]